MSCARHPDGDGPAWCQDCHGIHEIPRQEVVPTTRSVEGFLGGTRRRTLPRIHVPMNADEVAVADLVGDRREALNFGDRVALQRKPGESLAQHRANALAEQSVAKFYGLYWTGLGKGSDGRADVGGKLEVRSVRVEHHGLIARTPDPHRPHILVYVASPDCYLHGWLFPDEVRIERNLHRNSPKGPSAFWVAKRDDLRPCPQQDPGQWNE